MRMGGIGTQRRAGCKGHLAMVALAAPFLVALPQSLFIPSWYEVSLPLAGALLLLHSAVAAVTIARVVRRREWSWLARLASSLGLVFCAVAATLVTWRGSTREGLFLCGRELEDTSFCPGGEEVFVFSSVCIGGNPKIEIEVRPNILPFMYRVYHVPKQPDTLTAADACEALRRY
jgi:hypothetical protein